MRPRRKLSPRRGTVVPRHRYSRSRRRGPTPKYSVGDVCGSFIVVGYHGYSSVHPIRAKTVGQEHHWYKVRCTCGTEEYHTQQQLNDIRRHRECANCLEHRARSSNADTSQ